MRLPPGKIVASVSLETIGERYRARRMDKFRIDFMREVKINLPQFCFFDRKVFVSLHKALHDAWI